MLYKSLIRPVLFTFDPEKVHEFTLNFLSCSKWLYHIFKAVYSPSVREIIKVRDLQFHNRLGLAAGFDKNGVAIGFWNAVGFSHVEVGTVTPKPQTGNPKPRIFRLPKDSALINRLGFNNLGAEKVNRNIVSARHKLSGDFIIGVNIGKNKDTQINESVSDYTKCFEVLHEAADYFTINISSPNTEGLRKLHDEEHIHELLYSVMNLNLKLSKPKNIFLKVAPDLNDEQIETVYEAVIKNGLTGIVATNTTVSRDGLVTNINEQGGLSGKPLKTKSDNVLKKFGELNLKSSDKKINLIGVGGISGKRDYENKLRLGADLVQVYTGFIYEGPGIIKKILE